MNFSLQNDLNKYYYNLVGFISVIIFFGNFFSFLGGSTTIFNSGLSSLIKEISLNNLIDFFRSNYAFFSLIINLGVTFFLIFKKFKFNKLFIICFLVLFLPQLISLVVNKLIYDYFNIQSFTTILFIFSAAINVMNIFALKNSIYFKYVFILPFLALFFQLSLFFYNYSIFDIQYGGYSFEIKFKEKIYSLYFNSNGLGRSVSLIYGFAIFSFFDSNSKLKKVIYYLISFISFFIVLCLSGRFNSLMILIMNIFILLYYYKTIFKFNNIIILILSLFLLFQGVSYYKDFQKNLLRKEMSNKTLDFDKVQNLQANLNAFEINNKMIRQTPSVQNNEIAEIVKILIPSNKYFVLLDNLSTGRISKWIFIFSYSKKPIIGYGPNMDRIFFSERILKLTNAMPTRIIGSNDSASGIAYQYISSGSIGLICLIIFYLIIMRSFLKNKLYKQISTRERIFISLFFLLSFRMLFENSFMIFGIDYLFMIIGLQILTSSKTKTNH